MPGLLVNGSEHPVPDRVIINSNDADWCRLSPSDLAPRSTSWVRQIILHTTKGEWHAARARRPGIWALTYAQFANPITRRAIKVYARK
jgi:hypothetical protein